jgi:hypothetical protein
MMTKIWPKGKTKGEDALEYPDCWPHIASSQDKTIMIKSSKGTLEAVYTMSAIARMEFRPS